MDTSLPETPSASTSPHVRRPWWTWIVEYNPFYLLSAVSMLLGVLMLSNTTTWDPVPLGRLLPLLGTLQVYELCCLGVAVWLFRHIGPRRDTLQLIALVLLFAVDVSFLMSEIATAHLAVGIGISVTLLVLAAAKFGVVLAVVRPKLPPAAIVTGAAGLLALHATPSLLTWLDGDSGSVMVATFYGLWWIIGLSPLLYDAVERCYRDVRPWGEHESRWWSRAIAAMPWISLLIHTGVLHYVYDRPFMAPHAAPLLLGLALLLRRGTGEVAVVRTLLLLAAVGVSLRSPSQLDIEIAGDVTLTTATLASGVAWLAFAYVNMPKLLGGFAGALGVLALWRLIGPTWDQLLATVRSLGRTLMNLLPTTRSAWGAVAVAGAFVMLLVGVAVSFVRRPKQAEQAEQLR